MTSYANDTSVGAAAAATTTTTTAAAVAVPPAATSPPTSSAMTGVSDDTEVTTTIDHNKQIKHHEHYKDNDDDADSSDGREKTDTTPENLKKITEFISDNQKVVGGVGGVATPPRCLPVVIGPNAGLVGLAAAIDDSVSGKFCLGKPPPLPPQSPTTQKVASNNSTNNNNRDEDDSIESNSTTTATATATATTTPKQSLAFTIDHFDTTTTDAAAQAAKYKNMMERFQNRHKRGASMSKLETDLSSTPSTPTTTATAGATIISGGRQRNSLDATATITSTTLSNSNTTDEANPPTTTTTVKMRIRERSASRVRDASKRHSWSPRSSSSAATNTTTEASPKTTTTTTATTAAAPRRSTAAAATTTVKVKPQLKSNSNSSNNTITNRTQFTPRSTAMQLAFKQVELMCPQPPLIVNRSQSNMVVVDDDADAADDDVVSEAGTYTLDGDNYTEEQKDLMNIDRNALKARPKRLAVKPASNVLEVNYYHETPLTEKQSQLQQPLQSTKEEQQQQQLIMLGAHQSAGAFLEQLKTRRAMRGSCSNKDEELPPSSSPPSGNDGDVGCFTSVTTSGVLAKQRALDTHPKVASSRHHHHHHRNHNHSLSTSQIDSSEYVSNEAKLRNSQALAAGTATDHQKAEYRLNVFTSTTTTTTGATAEGKYAATRQLLLATPPETPTTPTSLMNKELSDTALLQTAQTKQDWIQEWARNARARSLAQDVSGSHSSSRRKQQDLMTRSYNCSDIGGGGGIDSSLTDDSLYREQRQYAAKLNRSLAERYRHLGDCDYVSDPALCSYESAATSGSGAGVGGTAYKPPKSPSKIPSPLHTLGRARSASRSRPPIPGDTNYLEQTAAAINSLQQSLSRKNSLKSPAHLQQSHSHTASPQHSLETGGAPVGYRRSPLHHNQQHHRPIVRDPYMTSSINEQQLQLLTSGDYLLQQLRHSRKNSLHNADDVDENAVEPPSATNSATTLSPLRRSSSFSATKILASSGSGGRQARPNFQNLYTPPAARNQHAMTTAAPLKTKLTTQQILKKSASSNNFGQNHNDIMYSDYDDNLQYYINDEDDDEMGGAYYSSGDDDDGFNEPSIDQNSVPLSNTRLNKALLMRIERSKQRVAAGVNNKPNSAPPGGKQPINSIVGCPNTPELPRRGVKSASRVGVGSRTANTNTNTTTTTNNSRQSMPREASLSRLAQQVPTSLANAKKQLLQTAAAATATSNQQQQRVQPRYMDISKYKSAQSNSFLRKNESKSTLKPGEQQQQQQQQLQMKRSPSASSMGLSRNDNTRASNRSVRSSHSLVNTSSSMGGNLSRASSAVRRDASVNKQKEAERAMWKRRSTYDPMKAAAEDRRRRQEAAAAAAVAAQQQQRQLDEMTTSTTSAISDVPFESVPRPVNNLTITGGGGSGNLNLSQRNSGDHHDPWTLGESSDYDEEDDAEEEEEDADVGDVDEYDDDDVDDADVDGIAHESDDVFDAESIAASEPAVVAK